MRFLLLVLLATASVVLRAAEVADWARGGVPEELPEAALLSIAITPFDPGLDESTAAPTALALRQAEARYVAYQFRKVLSESTRWGPVRLVPQADALFELKLTGTLLESSPRRLSVRLRAEDSSGRLWTDRVYQASATIEDYSEPEGEPFLTLYRAVASDLADFRATLPLNALEQLQLLARLSHAETVAPEVFTGYTRINSEGRKTINRLPARDDPMWARLDRVRQAEELFFDAVDQHQRAYADEMGPTYTAWRRVNLESQATLREYRKLEAGREKATAKQRYSALREAKYAEQTLRESLAAFKFEVGPTSLTFEGRLIEMSGTLERQQGQWRKLLEALFLQETGPL